MLRGIEPPDTEFVVEPRGEHRQRPVDRQASGVSQPIHSLEGPDHPCGIDQRGLTQAVDDRGPGLGKLIDVGQSGIGQVEKFGSTDYAAVAGTVGSSNRIAWGAIELAVLTEQERMAVGSIEALVDG